MNNLKEIVNIVKKIKLKSTDFLLEDATSNSKINLFYTKTLDNTFQTDEDAAQFFYKDTPNNSSYKNLKSSFRERLINTLWFFDHTSVKSGYGRAIIYCTKYFAAAQILLYLESKTTSNDLYKKVLKKAMEYELTDFILKCTIYLRDQAVLIYRDEKKFEEYNQLVNHYTKVYQIELRAKEYYHRLIIPYNSSKSIKEDTSQKAKNYYSELEVYLQEYDAPQLHLLGYYIKSIYLFSKNDYEGLIEMSEEAIAFFERKNYTYNAPIIAFCHILLVSHIQLKQYEAGVIATRKSKQLHTSGSYNWYINQELNLMLVLHTKKYEDGPQIVYESLKHRKFKHMNISLQEKWTIYKAYIHFLIYIGKIPEETNCVNLGQFRKGKFLNSVPIFSKDKRGLNIPILVIQILFMIVKKDYDNAIDRIEAIEKYCSRYLKKEDNLRSNCFIRALLQVPISSFHKNGVNRRAKKYIDQLKTVPLEIANQSHEVEVIPYEDLWEFVIDSLGTKFYKPRKK